MTTRASRETKMMDRQIDTLSRTYVCFCLHVCVNVGHRWRETYGVSASGLGQKHVEWKHSFPDFYSLLRIISSTYDVFHLQLSLLAG